MNNKRAYHKAFKKMCLLLTLMVVVMQQGILPTASQDTSDGVSPQTQPIDTQSLPVLFDEDFEGTAIDPDIWAFDIREVELLTEADDDETNSVMQVGHLLEWSEATLLEGKEWRNYIVELDVKLLQYVDGADNLFLGVRFNPDLGEYAISLDLARRQAAISSTFDDIWQGITNQAPLVLDLSTWYRLRVHVQEDYIGFFVNDEFIAQVSDGSIGEGSIRLLTSPGSFAQFDNIVVHEIPSSAERGDLLITEFMFRDNSQQWFELYNDSSRYLELDGLEITNGSESFEVAQEGLLFPPRSYMLFAKEDVDYFPDHTNLYIDENMVDFAPDNGYFSLRMHDEIITEIAYSEDTNWPLQDNVSVALHPDYFTRRRENNGINWCLSVNKVSENPVIRATPGDRNHMCVRELALTELNKRQHGDVIINEIMVKVSGADEGREWFEIYNPSDTEVNLTGLTLATDKPTERHTITAPLTIAPRSYLVLAQAGLETSDLPPELTVYFYPGDFKISNDLGELTILDGDRVIDTISYRDTEWWGIRADTTMNLHPDAMSVYSNDDALNWCLAWTRYPLDPTQRGTPGAVNDPCPMWEINSPMRDVPEAYELVQDTPVTMHVTIDPEHLTDMAANPFSDTVYPMHFSADGFETVGTEINGNIRPRGGRGTRSAGMFSYRIHLDNDRFWGKDTFRLSKHLGDPSRLRNSLAFRLFKDIDGLVSLRTQFVHLFINGEDQGLYTMIENTSASMLRDHRLDPRGNYFKVILPSGVSSFFYYRNSDRESRIQSIQATTQIEAGAAQNHNGLIEMMDALYSDQDVQTVIDRHFNFENLMSYYAAIYLIQNRDTRVQNYMLYSTPREPYRVYFLPWDWDNGFQVRGRPGVFVGRWREGLGNWTGLGIFDRVLEDPEMVDALVMRMVELAQTTLSRDHIHNLITNLVQQVEPFTRRSPENLVMTPGSLAEEAAAIETVLPTSAEMLIESIEWPLPVLVEGAEYDSLENAVIFRWQKTFDLQDDPLTYEVVLFNERIWDESNIVWRSPRTDHSSLKITPDDLPDEVAAGPYYWMVYVWDDDNNYNTSSLGTRGDIEMVVDLP